jgi:NADH-quinone oxidoreductase subunit I
MTNKYDFSVVDITQLNFEFSNLSLQQANEKRKLYEQYLEEKEALKSISVATATRENFNEIPKPKTSFKPAFKPAAKPIVIETEEQKDEIKEISIEPKTSVLETVKSKPVFKPSFKSAPKGIEETKIQLTKSEDMPEEISTDMPKPKPDFKPSFKPETKPEEITETQEINTEEIAIEKPKPVFKPTMKITSKK